MNSTTQKVQPQKWIRHDKYNLYWYQPGQRVTGGVPFWGQIDGTWSVCLWAFPDKIYPWISGGGEDHLQFGRHHSVGWECGRDEQRKWVLFSPFLPLSSFWSMLCPTPTHLSAPSFVSTQPLAALIPASSWPPHSPVTQTPCSFIFRLWIHI